MLNFLKNDGYLYRQNQKTYATSISRGKVDKPVSTS